jgi:uncharacterized protein
VKRFRPGRLAKAQWRRFGRACRRYAAPHRRASVIGLLVICGGIFLLATFPSHHGKKISGPQAALSEAVPARPLAHPEKSVQPAAPSREATARPPPPLPRPAAAKPAWLRYAVPAPATGNRPLVAIVLDDLGLDRARSAKAIGLHGPLTLSFMTYANDLAAQTQAARRAGHELLLHVPMEAIDRLADPGPHGLYTGLSRDEIIERLRWGLGRFDGFVGINNHMGSKFTADERGMAPVMEELRARGLVFLDSRTTPASVGIRLAATHGVPHAQRDVFLDDDLAPAAIANQLGRVEQLARQHGSAVAIGHPHDATIAALEIWLPTLAAKGLALVPVSAVVQHRMSEEVDARR